MADHMSALPQLPRSIPDPGRPPTPMTTITRWDTFLGDIASGMPLVEAMKKSWISRADIETMTRLNDGGVQLQRWTEAKLSGLKSSWSIMQIDDFFALIAAGEGVKPAHLQVFGAVAGSDIYNLINQDPDFNLRYKKAKEAHMISMAEGITEIVDDASNDVLDTGGKSGRVPNNAAVARSKLRADNRFRLMASYNAKMFGEKPQTQVNVQINNHAEQLEAARERAKNRGAIAPPKKPEAIEAVFTSTPEADTDTSWMDTAPTTWREEK